MRTRISMLCSLILLSLIGLAGIAAADDNQTVTTNTSIPAYTGSIGPGSTLYGLKLAFENLDESFTFNQSERLEKQITHADIRLAELQRELLENRTELAEIALEQYWLKMNQTAEVLDRQHLNGTGPAPEIDETGLQHAREMITKHQEVLENLIQIKPNNTGLERAYENSIALEEKFDKKAEEAKNVRQQANQNRQNMPLENRTALDNMTFQYPDPGMGIDGNRTAEVDWNQSRDMNKFSGNTTKNMDQNREGINQSLQDPGIGQGNSANDKQNNQNAQESKGNTTTGPAVDNKQSQNTGNNDNSAVNPAGGSNSQNGQDINTNRNTGATNSGNTKENGRNNGR